MSCLCEDRGSGSEMARERESIFIDSGPECSEQGDGVSGGEKPG